MYRILTELCAFLGVFIKIDIVVLNQEHSFNLASMCNAQNCERWSNYNMY